jgi:alpha-amylase
MRRSIELLLRRTLAAAALLLAAAPLSATTILHAFNWRYADVGARAAEIAERGYDAVLVAPPLRSEGSAWWARYQPQDYRVIDHPLGNSEDFRAMVLALGTRGVATYADVVLNHMANEAAQRSDLDFPGTRVLDIYARNAAQYARWRLFGDLGQNLFGAADFNPARCISNYLDPVQVQNGRLCGGGADPGLPDLAATERVIAQQQTYLRALKAIGVVGFRIDAAKHMPLAHLERVFTPDILADSFVFGEIITGGGVGNEEYRLFLAPYLAGTSHAAYDFPLHVALRRGFGFGGNLAELADVLARGQALAGARAVTFTVTHDIPNNPGFRGQLLDPVDETLAYAFVLGRGEGTVLLYSDNNESGDNRWVSAWKRDDLTAMVRFHNAAEGSSLRWLSTSNCHLLFRRGGLGIVGINKCGNEVEARFKAPQALRGDGVSYRDVLSSDTLTISRLDASVRLPPRSARLWLRTSLAPPSR